MPEPPHQPDMLLCASALDADLAWEFADVIDKTGTVAVTLVAFRSPQRLRSVVVPGHKTSPRRRLVLCVT
ncbi:hypothetical protein [Streptomyces sp. NPDC097610]|uniref:hypothetical protein n=1 Tax=Streptomyces sp. NPDC097610 TaxID=3157227 RepID=UPI00331D9DC9